MPRYHVVVACLQRNPTRRSEREYEVDAGDGEHAENEAQMRARKDGFDVEGVVGDAVVIGASSAIADTNAWWNTA